MLRKLLLVAIGFYLGYKTADGVEVTLNYDEEPDFDGIIMEALRESNELQNRTQARGR